MFSFFKKRPKADEAGTQTQAVPAVVPVAAATSAAAAPVTQSPSGPAPGGPCPRKGWLDRLRSGLRKTGSSIAQVFTGTQIDDACTRNLRMRCCWRTRASRPRNFAGRPEAAGEGGHVTEPQAVRLLLVDAR